MENPIIAAISMISQGAMYPVIVALVLMLLVTVVLVVTTVVEYFTERRLFKVSVPQLVRDLEESDCQGIPGTIAASDLVKRQKIALMQLFNVRDLPQEARWNVAKRAVYECGEHYRRREAVAEVLAKIAPMVGLMGTIIPLGPGLQALSTGQIGDLASALVVAFDTTVLGLLSAALCLLVARVRNRWNTDYANALDSLTGTLFDKLADLEEAGDLEYVAPSFELQSADGEEDAGEKAAGESEEDAHGKDE
ncbi:MAG: MotA/TolQ/ExbB proton channel family protein [Coriobacteriia bacterium]|nr:MotA/TolQ/ExbB proton channel family protein [Coriobacteriia bacterium]